jgi:hypothetical protein
MKYTVNLSFQQSYDSKLEYKDYLVTAKDSNTAVNKAFIKLIKEYNPYYFIWNQVSEYTKAQRSDTPLIG